MFLAAVYNGAGIPIVVATVLFKGVLFSAPYAIWLQYFATQFPPEVRFTGMGVSTQLAVVMLGFIPAICFSLLAPGPLGWIPVACFAAALCLISAVAVAFFRPGHDSVPTKAESLEYTPAV